MLDIVDSHCHLYQLPGWRGPACPDRQAAMAEISGILDNAKRAGVSQVVVPACSWDDFALTSALGEQFSEVWLAFGLHPHDANAWTASSRDELRAALAHPRAVAVGECGLDYHYDLSPRDVQRTVFANQILLAQQVGKPLIIHTREAESDTIEIMRCQGAARAGGVMHCFTGSADLAQEALGLGFYISFSGVLCFAKSSDLRSVASEVPLDRTLVETDAPYLAPPPYRSRRNEPAYVVRVIDTLASIHGLEPEEMARLTARNARRLFKLPLTG